MSKTLISKLNQPGVREFIQTHWHDDPAALALKGAGHDELPFREILAQIQARKKAEVKLPEWFRTEGIIFPPGVSMEQCSSEQTARYKASLASGKIITDLTGGFGIDLFYFSKNFEKANYIEQSGELVELAQYNFKKLMATNISLLGTSAEAFLNKEEEPATLYYIDPARRDESNKKVFRIEDCTPDLNLIIPQILERKSEALIKMSPMLDIRQALETIPFVKEIHVVSVRNECKELLFWVAPDFNGSPMRMTVNLKDNKKEMFEFSEVGEKNIPAFSQPLNFLYEPNSSIMKAGGFNSISNAFEIFKLHRNSHLYTSNQLIENFPGRVFHIKEVTVLNKKKMKSLLPHGKANIAVRNYPMNVKAIRTKSGIKEGGETYLFATTLMDQAFKILVCTKVR